MAENDEIIDARSRQLITARKNQLRNQAQEQESPGRAKPKAKSEPFKFNRESTAVEDVKVKDDGKPETTHEPKGKSGRPPNIKKDKPQNKNPTHDTEKDEDRTRTHWRKAPRQYLVDQLAKRGWRWPTPEGQNAKPTQR